MICVLKLLPIQISRLHCIVKHYNRRLAQIVKILIPALQYGRAETLELANFCQMGGANHTDKETREIQVKPC